jgi:hypothetical protein
MENGKWKIVPFTLPTPVLNTTNVDGIDFSHARQTRAARGKE